MPKWQLEQIRAQVLAQRLLTRNAHVSSGLLLASRGVSSGSPVPSSKLSSTVDTTVSPEPNALLCVRTSLRAFSTRWIAHHLLDGVEGRYTCQSRTQLCAA